MGDPPSSSGSSHDKLQDVENTSDTDTLHGGEGTSKENLNKKIISFGSLWTHQ